MDKLFKVTITSVLQLPASAAIISGTDDNEGMEHIVVDGHQLRPEVTWLEYHAKGPRGLKGITESIWISVADDVVWRYLQPTTEEWSLVEEPPPSRKKRPKRVQ